MKRVGYRDTVARLSAGQKPGVGAPPYSRFINRRLGRWLAAAAHLIGMTPNQVTALSAVCTFSGLGLIALVEPQWWLGLIVCFLLVIGYAFDAADGQLARLLGGGSVVGEWLDHVVDATKTCLLHSAVLIFLYRFTSLPEWSLIIPLCYQAVASVFFFSFILVEQLRRSAGRPIHRTDAALSASGRLQAIGAFPTDYGVLCLTFLLLPARTAFFTVYATLFALNSIVVAAALVRWFFELNRMGGIK